MSDNARDQAILQVESVVSMVRALQADYDRLDELREERDDWVKSLMDACGILEPSDDSRVVALRRWAQEFPEDAEELAELEDAAGDCSDDEEARERIQNDPLSIEVRSDWCNYWEEMTPSEARIVLCTGGPHVEILCDLDRGQPSRPRVIYKDWGTSGELFDFDHDAVTTYLEQLYFGE